MPTKVVAVDLDKTLAKHRAGQEGIGKPIPAMVRRVQDHLRQGHRVVVFTARLARTVTTREERAKIHKDIGKWTKKHVGKALGSTAEKRPEFYKIYDDRAVSVQPNRGRVLTEPRRPRTR